MFTTEWTSTTLLPRAGGSIPQCRRQDMASSRSRQTEKFGWQAAAFKRAIHPRRCSRCCHRSFEAAQRNGGLLKVAKAVPYTSLRSADQGSYNQCALFPQKDMKLNTSRAKLLCSRNVCTAGWRLEEKLENIGASMCAMSMNGRMGQSQST